MENLYNDELMPENYEQIARAYSKSLKSKGFVFISLEEEEFELLISEIFNIIAKMQACLKRLKKQMDAKILEEKLNNACLALQEKFGRKNLHSFKCIEDESAAFLSLVALENLLTLKLMLLSVKSGELEVCNAIITSIAGIFAESFSCEGFAIQ